MASMNKTFLIGHLTRAPELRYTASGAPVCTLGLAVNNKFTKDGETKEEVLFVDVNVWAKMAENCVKYLDKGSPILVEGRLKFRAWESPDGAKRSKIDVTAFNVQFLSFDKPKDDAPPVADDEDEDVPF